MKVVCQLDINAENIVAWQKLKQHRERASHFRLDILVWGPSDDGSTEYKKRCEIRDELKKRGHNATFSEDLCADEEALKNRLTDEYIQAESADAIVMIYGSRGTQTERDKFLDDVLIAKKTYVLVRKEVLSNVHESISSSNWERMARFATVYQYEGDEELHARVNDIYKEIDELRKECYVERLKMSRGQKHEIS